MAIPTISLAGCFGALSQPDGSLESQDAFSSDDASLAELMAVLRTACEEVGFFCVVDHGVDAALMEQQLRECRAFFERPPQCSIIGMVDSGASRFAWLDFVPPEEDPQSEPRGGADAWSLGPVAGRGSMPWRPDSEALATTWGAYYAAVERLVKVLMRLCALALGLPVGAFDEALRGHRSSMRAILYPEVSEADLEAAGGVVERSPTHTDWGCITVLLPDLEIGGLEVCCKDGVWVPLQAEPGSLVVNLGDLLPWWTEGRWVATPHRVVAKPGKTRMRRLSVPYFGLVNRATVLAPLRPPPPEDWADDDHDVAAQKRQKRQITAGEFFSRHEQYARKWLAPAGGS